VRKAPNSDPRKTANSSGFPLQIRIADVTNASRKWKVIFEELPWKSPFENVPGGFIDLVARLVGYETAKQYNLVVECKRVLQTEWVFLIPGMNTVQRSHANLWLSHFQTDTWHSYGWSQMQAYPKNDEAKYCAIPGHANGRQNLIERSCADLVESVEGLALQEKTLKSKLKTSFYTIYIPVIVTTAKLRVAHFNPKDISLDEGKLPGSAQFKTVPYLRYRKSFSCFYEDADPHESMMDIVYQSERTVFIVNSESYANFLTDFHI